tara:strand:+ start:2854 stop:3120 length:267 start_codon:yes stop_codon:yes gene_type:complete
MVFVHDTIKGMAVTNNTTKGQDMTTTATDRYQPRISKDADGSFYALIVRVDYDGCEEVIYGYDGRHFKTLKAATKSTTNYITKHNLND